MTRILILLAVSSGAIHAQETAPPVYPDRSKLLHWLDENGDSHPISRPKDWQHRRAHVLANMSRVMGPLPKRDGSKLDVKVVSSERLRTLTRKKVTGRSAIRFSAGMSIRRPSPSRTRARFWTAGSCWGWSCR